MHLNDEPSVFEEIKEGLKECIRFTKGELTLRTTMVPTRPPRISAKEIVAWRRQLNMSQGVFARLMNVSIKTVQSWEQGERTPSQAALRLLQVFQAEPEVVCDIAGLRTSVPGKGNGRDTGKRKPTRGSGAKHA
jgi:putative transcriptional regulator